MSTAQAVKRGTKEAIMDAAETVMAEHGVDGASIRAIVTMAGANTAAIHYHFNSRDGLIKAMLGRHGRTTSLRRLDLIREIDQRDAAPVPMDIANIFVDPMIELLKEEGEAGRRFLRFIARLQSDRRSQSGNTGLQIQEERKYFPEIRERLLDLIGQACPGIPELELNERLTMIVDTMLLAFANAEFMTTEWEADEQLKELHRFASNLKSFLAGGLAAPVTE